MCGTSITYTLHAMSLPRRRLVLWNNLCVLTLIATAAGGAVALAIPTVDASISVSPHHGALLCDFHQPCRLLLFRLRAHWNTKKSNGWMSVERVNRNCIR